MKKRFKGIFFDMGGTLIFPDPERISMVFSRIQSPPPSPKDVLDSIHHATAEMDEALEGGKRLSRDWWTLYFGGMIRHLKTDKPLSMELTQRFFQDLKTDHEKNNLWARLADGAMEILESLAEKKYYLGVISNSDGRVKSQLEENGLFHHFSFVLDSHVVKCEKPDPEIFRMGLKISGLKADEVLYVGDFVNIDFIGATQAGMSALIVDPLGLRKKNKAPRITRLSELPAWLEKDS